MSGPLDGVRVVEMSHMVMGPTCGMVLAQLGAEVIKVEPEVGDKTRSLGGMGTSFFPLFNRGKRSVTLDLKSEDGREALTLQQVVDRCFGGNTALCAGITRNAAGVITAITRTPINVNTEGLKGLDIEASYRTDLSTIAEALPGSLTLRGLATYTDTRFTDDGRTRDEQAGENNGAIPKWRVNYSVGYDDATFAAVVTGRYVSSGVYDKAYTTATLSSDDNHIPGATYVDLALRMKFQGGGTKGEFFFNVDNLFNKDPVIVAPINQQFLVAPVNALLYDTLGREFKAGVRVRY